MNIMQNDPGKSTNPVIFYNRKKKVWYYREKLFYKKGFTDGKEFRESYNPKSVIIAGKVNTTFFNVFYEPEHIFLGLMDHVVSKCFSRKYSE